MDIQLHQAPFVPAFTIQFIHLSKIAFGTDATQTWINSLNWRLTNMPDVTVFAMFDDDNLIAYKAGYASAYDTIAGSGQLIRSFNDEALRGV